MVGDHPKEPRGDQQVLVVNAVTAKRLRGWGTRKIASVASAGQLV